MSLEKIKKIAKTLWGKASKFEKKHDLKIYSVLRTVGLLLIVLYGDILKGEPLQNGISLIILLLSVLCIDIFVILFKYLSKLKLDTNNILNSVSIQNPDKLPDFKYVTSAQECVFISGTNMRFIEDDRAKFVSVDSNVKIIFAISNISLPNVKVFLKKSYGKTDKEMDDCRKRFYKDFEYINRKRAELHKTELARFILLDVPVPIAYHAIDYKKEMPGSSVIHAKHYLLCKELDEKGKMLETTKAFNLSVYPRTKLYEKYREEILLIEKYGEKLSTRFTSK